MNTPTLPAWARTQIDAYWADFLGCTPADLRPAQSVITRSDKSPGLTAFRADGEWIIALAPDADSAAADAVLPLLESGDHTDKAVRDHMHLIMEQYEFDYFYGPSELLYLTRDMLLPVPGVPFRQLTTADTGIVDAFRVGMGGTLDWKINEAQWPYTIGHFDGSTLIAAAAVCNWGGGIAETYVDTLPAYRGRGLANALTYEITRWIVEDAGWIAQAGGEVYNTPSGRISRRLGYAFYGHLFMNNLARA